MARFTKFFKFVIHIATFIVISFFLNQKRVRPVRNVERFVADIRHLLLWTKLPGLDQEGQHIFLKKQCENINCYLTTNRTLLGDVRHFDAIIFNVEDMEEKSNDLPSMRSTTQKYIFAANDSADKFPVCSSVYDNFFNWTWSYKQDSSIPFTFITVYNLDKERLGVDLQWIKNMEPIDKLLESTLVTKSKAAAIFLDKCETQSKREIFLRNLQKELAKYNMTVDVFGKCGTMTCNRKTMKPCFYRLKATYYFYLALEDSIAPDFITNILLNGYNNNAVPIVYGGAKYDRYLPPNSYLDATKLSESMLAKTMNDIIQNKELYHNLFRWKNHYAIKETAGMNICILCEVMNNPAWLQIQATFVKFRSWWNEDYEKRCGIKKYYFL